jgi:hypothetical protein
MGDEPVADADRAGIGRQIAGDQPQRRRLAAARRAEQGHELVIPDVQIEIGDGSHLGLLAIVLGQLFDAYARHQAVTPARSTSRLVPLRRLAIQIAAPMIAMLTIASAETGSTSPVS